MKIRFIGSTSENGDCPSLYEVDEVGDDRVLVQGELVDDPEIISQARHVKAGEGFLLIPRELLTRFAPRD